MSITDELREWAARELASWKMARERYDALAAIADRIDAEHEEAMQREHEVGYAEGCGAGLATVALGAPEWIAQHEGEMAKQGWIRLPKGADEVPWNVGDRDEDGNVVTHLMLTSSGWFVITTDGWPHSPARIRHYHAPTVEDVLTEFGIDWEHESDCEDRAALLKEYAAKLRLAEGED